MADAPLAFVVDDEPDMRDIISFALETHGFRTEMFGSAEKAWTELQRRVPDLLVIDVMLPGASGITLCTRVKALWRVPVMLVTARSETADRIQGFEAEADDYVGKPFHPRELALRAQRLVRWNDDASGATREWGAIRLEPALSEVIVDGARLRVTTTEFALLNALVGARGATVDYPQLLLAAWGAAEQHGGRDMLKAAVYRLRHKLDGARPGAGDVIASDRGRGYSIRSDYRPADVR